MGFCVYVGMLLAKNSEWLFFSLAKHAFTLKMKFIFLVTLQNRKLNKLKLFAYTIEFHQILYMHSY